MNSTIMNSFLSLPLPRQQTKVTPITTPLKSNRMEEIVQEWYANFVNVDQTLLFELVTAANFMDIKALLDLTCLAVSILIKVCYPKYGSYDFRQSSETNLCIASSNIGRPPPRLDVSFDLVGKG